MSRSMLAKALLAERSRPMNASQLRKNWLNGVLAYHIPCSIRLLYLSFNVIY